MSFPQLDDGGELPAGVHRATISELLARFGAGIPQRREVARRLHAIHDLAVKTGALDRVVVFGSFVTAKAEPRDVDVVLVMRDNFDLARCPTDALPLFDHLRAESEFRASVFWIRPSLLILQSLEEFIAGWQQKRDGNKRGIVEVIG